MTGRAPTVRRGRPGHVDVEAGVVVIGAGACGLTAALKAAASGADVIVLERDAEPTGSTSLSSGFVPAPATRYQHAAGIADDSAALFEADILAKSKGRSDEALARLAARAIGPALEWLGEVARIDWIVLDDFLYPGHSRHRMHAVPEKTGAALQARLLSAAISRGIPIVTQAKADTLFLGGDGRIAAAGVVRPDGARETVSCEALVLACNGYGGNADLVRRHIPEITGGIYFGHPGNTGDAVHWGEALGARRVNLSGYQGHGSVAHPHGILISWAVITRGGFQINAHGQRFHDESTGYSEAAVAVLKQPDRIAWTIYDEAIHDLALGFPDYRDAVAAGAVRAAPSIAALAREIGVPAEALSATFDAVEAARRNASPDPFGRDFTDLAGLTAPFRAVKVTGALFHTQGGLVIDGRARVLSEEGVPFANLLAGGGAACGVSGPNAAGYLSGNGLLTAIAFGFLAGESAASIATGRVKD